MSSYSRLNKAFKGALRLPLDDFCKYVIISDCHRGCGTSNCSDIVPMDIYLTHGHQTEPLNSTLWPVARFLVRYLWSPLERVGVLDPTSAAQNNTRKYAAEKKLHACAKREKHILITGHTHRPALDSNDPYYCNSGSCVHPRCITCLEIEHMKISLVKWSVTTGPDMSLYVEREVLSEGFRLV